MRNGYFVLITCSLWSSSFESFGRFQGSFKKSNSLKKSAGFSTCSSSSSSKPPSSTPTISSIWQRRALPNGSSLPAAKRSSNRSCRCCRSTFSSGCCRRCSSARRTPSAGRCSKSSTRSCSCPTRLPSTSQPSPLCSSRWCSWPPVSASPMSSTSSWPCCAYVRLEKPSGQCHLGRLLK